MCKKKYNNNNNNNKGLRTTDFEGVPESTCDREWKSSSVSQHVPVSPNEMKSGAGTPFRRHVASVLCSLLLLSSLFWRLAVVVFLPGDGGERERERGQRTAFMKMPCFVLPLSSKLVHGAKSVTH